MNKNAAVAIQQDTMEIGVLIFFGKTSTTLSYRLIWIISNSSFIMRKTFSQSVKTVVQHVYHMVL